VLITKDQWNEKEKMINSKNSNYRFLNNHLREKIKGIQQYELELSVKGQSFSPEFLEMYLRGASEKNNFSFNDFYKEKMDEEKGIALGTYRGYKRALNKLNEYNTNIRFSDINYQFVKDFENFMIGQGLKVNSRAVIHTMVKKFLNIAVSCELLTIKQMPYNTQAGGGVGKFSIPSEPGTKVPLNFEERERFEKLEYPHSERFDRLKDVFLFLCYTGLRHSDAKAFNFTHLVHTGKGYSIDLHKMIKTKRSVYLELFTLFDGKPEKILRKYLIKKYGTDKYEDIIKTGDNTPIFRAIDGPGFNEKLKIMARDAKIQKNLSTHCGRHTFGTQMAILTSGNQYLIMDLLGHCDPETTLTYIKLGERMVNQQLRNVNWSAYDPKPIEKELKGIQEEPVQEIIKEQSMGTEEKNDSSSEILEYIYNEVIPELDFSADEKIPFSIDVASLTNYVGLLPFSPEDLKRYQDNPFELRAFIIGMKYAKYVEELQKALNKTEWFRQSCMKIQLGFIPVPFKELKIIEI
jgi:integrase